MCGLAGMAGDLNHQLKEAFKDLLIVTQFRGRDSTGVFAVRNDNTYDHLKGLGTPELLLDRKAFDARVLTGIPKVIAGHCRSKTVGDNTVENAHPYDFDNLIGMHNGTLRSAHKLDGHDYRRTDSFSLYSDMSKNGLSDTMTRVDPDGAYALVWWDAQDNTLNFLRNDQRPLWFAWTKNKRAIVWASEPWMFGAIDRKASLWDGKGENGEADRSPYFQLPVDQHWKFTVDGLAKPAEPPMTLHPVREVKAEGKKGVGFQGGHWKNGTYVGPSTQNSNTSSNSSNAGGKVVSPFVEDDSLEDIGKRAVAPFVAPTTVNPAASAISTTTPVESSTSLPRTLDFRPVSMRGTRSSKPILSLLERTSGPTPQVVSGKNSSESNVFSLTPTTTPSQSRLHGTARKTSIRKSPALGHPYITDHKTGLEWSEKTFEENTGAVCGFCKSPIGSLEEVHEFFQRGRMFTCTNCTTQPNVSMAG